MTEAFKAQYAAARRELIRREFAALNERQQEAVLTTQGPLLLPKDTRGGGRVASGLLCTSGSPSSLGMAGTRFGPPSRIPALESLTISALASLRLENSS